ncbi:NAD(P)-binding Rossmann-fold superfamily protein isoform 1 [Hibiscus syriacus]|uniref:NAD(P)-binding Rossmann-fold superfamily protein isoform 1 n=1 Tax=Hibiscus syriacus TaxID=106335 RepID=A0A6A3B5Q3_HIBSY|nr:NAD(P)-binding Rossmann-fold superfamily protein isoform 1 [Hibiscus syriacus]
MENYRGEGDLNDIVRASGTGDPLSCATGQGSDTVPTSSWQQFPSDPLNFPSSATEGHGLNAFGDPFSTIRDPLLHELSSTYFSSPNSAYHHHRIINTSSSAVDETSSLPGSTTIVGQSKMFEEDMRSPCNIFSRIQISPISLSKLPVSPCDSPMMAATGVSPRGIKAPAVLPSDMINAKTASKSCLIDNTGPVQISSPRNLGIKRRKSQVKKVVCIPAPAAANSRSSGEVVPSDLWHGENMAETHQRDTTDAAVPKAVLQGSKWSEAELIPTCFNDALSPTNAAAFGSTPSASAKEESEDMEKQLEPDDFEFGVKNNPSNLYTTSINANRLPASGGFLAELDEIETDPLHLLFPQGFSGTDQDEQKETKTMDPFGPFDWPGNNNASF